EQQSAASEAVDQREGKQGRGQHDSADRDGLQVLGRTTEARHGENVVEVIENGIDADQLVEHGEKDRKRDRPPMPPLKEPIRLRAAALIDRSEDRRQLRLRSE